MAHSKTQKKSSGKASKPTKKPAPKVAKAKVGKPTAKAGRAVPQAKVGKAVPPPQAAAKSGKAAPPPQAAGKPGKPGAPPQAHGKPGKPPPGKPGGPILPSPTRAPARAPERAEELKQKIGALASAIHQIKTLKRTFNRSFYEIGEILRDVRDRRLYEAKGYGSFEAFVEREIDLGKQLSLRVVRVVSVFLREAAISAGLERASAAIAALDGEAEGQGTSGGTTAAPAGGPGLPARSASLPPHKV